jgi:hypothetical protein
VAYRAFWRADFKPIGLQMPKRRKVMQKTVYNPQKGRLETIDIAFTDENTTWFDDTGNSAEVSKITDFDGGLVISDRGYSYPVLIYDVSRADINHSRQKALELLQPYTQP